MKRPLTSGELALLRTHPQKVEYYLALHKPKAVYRGLLSAVTGQPVNAITTHSVTVGNGSTIKPGMTVRLGSAPLANDYGDLRLRGSSGDTTLLIGESGSGNVNWQANAHVAVIEDYRAWPIHHSYDSANSRWLVDQQVYTNQLSQYGPQVIMGPPDVLFLDGGKALGKYVGNLSYSHTPGVSITSQRWNFPNGVAVTSALGSSAAPVLITYLNASPGGEYFSLSATDSNGASHIGHRLLFVFGSGASMPTRVRFDQIAGGLRTGGYRTRLFVADTANSSVYQDGAQVVIVERASYGTVGSSVGGNYFARDSIVMTGRILSESQRIEPFTEEVSFAVETINGELRQTGAYDLFLENVASASSWDTAVDITLDRAAIALIKYRSTIANVTDFNLAGGLAESNIVPFRSLPAQSLWEQLNYNYQASFGIIAADMQGTLWAQLDAQITGLSETLPSPQVIQSQDQRDQITIEREHRDSNAMTRMFAIQGGTSIPLGGESPGTMQGYFGGRLEVSRNLTVPDQDTLITWAGNGRAKENNKLASVSIPLAGNYRLDPVPQSRFTLPASNGIRPPSASHFFGTEAEINFDGETALGLVEVEAVVNGFGGSAITFPRIDPFEPPEFPDPPEEPPPWEDPPLPDPDDDPPDPGGGVGWHTFDELGEVTSLFVLGDHIYSAGWTYPTVSSDRLWRVEKRLVVTGELVWERNITTSVGTNTGPTDTNQINDIWVNGTNVFCIGWERVGVNTRRALLVALLDSDGSTDWTKTYNDPGSGANPTTGIKLVGDGSRLYSILGYGGSELHGEVRALSLVDGSIIWETDFLNTTSGALQSPSIALFGGVLTCVLRQTQGTTNPPLVSSLDPSTGGVLWTKEFQYLSGGLSQHVMETSTVMYSVGSGSVGDPVGARRFTQTFNSWGATGFLYLDMASPHLAIGTGLLYIGWSSGPSNDTVTLSAINKTTGFVNWTVGFNTFYTLALEFQAGEVNRLIGGGRKSNLYFYTVCWIR